MMSGSDIPTYIPVGSENGNAGLTGPDDNLLLGALRELGNILGAKDVPHWVVETFPRLSEIQVKLFTTVFVQDSAHGAADCFMRLQPTNLLLELIAAAKARDWPRFVVLVHGTSPEIDLPEGLPA